MSRAVSVDETVAFMGIRPSFIKVDVEGAEVFVLEGMRATLERFRPVLMLEVHPGSGRRRILLSGSSPSWRRPATGR